MASSPEYKSKSASQVLLAEDLCVFQKSQLKDLDEAIALAGELVWEAFRVDLEGRWPVDIRLWPELDESEKKGDNSLAQLFRYTRKSWDGIPARTDFYRICLYDPSILAAASRENLDLKALLIYVLTHEFVHVARFIGFKEIFGLDPAKRDEEETLVHSETQKLLEKVPIIGLPKVIGLYRSHLLPLDRSDKALGT
jgi:hypothetical protein